MSLVLPSGTDKLLAMFVKLEGKLLALQKANTASLVTKGYGSPINCSKTELVLGHIVSSISTDCPDVVSTEEDEDANDSETSSDAE